METYSRKTFLQKSLLSAAGLFAAPLLLSTAGKEMVLRAIPSTGEKVPAIGMGSWLTFNVGEKAEQRAPMRQVLKTFVESGGRVIDSSPMYGRSERVIGELAGELGVTDKLWVATKVWTSGEEAGKSQISNSVELFRKWPAVLQVHNLLDLKIHLKTLRKLKDEGKLKYVGITHYVNSSHERLANLLKTEPLDFLQINLSVRNTASEDYLLPLAADRGVAVIINQPFETGALFNHVQGVPLPPWAKDWLIGTWASYFLKYIISNSSVTCVIPATTQVAHVKENMAAMYSPLPDGNTRQKMVEYFKRNAK